MTNTMPRCMTCKWWYPILEDEIEGTGKVWGEHGWPKGYGICELASSADNVPRRDGHRRGAPEPGNVLAVALVDVSDWSNPVDAELVTAAEFGCVQHEPREDGTQ